MIAVVAFVVYGGTKPSNHGGGSGGESKASVTILPAGGEKQSIKSIMKGADSVVEGKGLMLRLGAFGMTGTYGNYLVDGARNLFSSKDKGEVDDANRLATPWFGTMNVNGVLVGDAAHGTASVKKSGGVPVSIAAD